MGTFLSHTACTLDNRIFVVAECCEMMDLNPHDDADDDNADTVNDADNDEYDNQVWVEIGYNGLGEQTGRCLIGLDKKLYVLGGAYGKFRVDVFDLGKEVWENVANMQTMRWCSAVAVLDRKIYISGGLDLDRRSAVASAECYDPDSNTWSFIASMNIARQRHELVSLHGKLYAIGGEGVEDVEVYDPDNNTWTVLEHKLLNDAKRDDFAGIGLIKKCYLKHSI